MESLAWRNSGHSMNTPNPISEQHHVSEKSVSFPNAKMETDLVAQLLTIDIGRLVEGDKQETAKLFKAAEEDGIFYLNFQDRRFVDMIELVDGIFALSKELFDLSEEDKMQYDVDELGPLKLNGYLVIILCKYTAVLMLALRYKPVGRNLGGERFHVITLRVRYINIHRS